MNQLKRFGDPNSEYLLCSHTLPWLSSPAAPAPGENMSLSASDMDQDKLKQQQKDFLRDIEFITTKDDICTSGQIQLSSMNHQFIIQDTGTILPIEGGELVEQREYVLPNGDRYIVQSPVKTLARQTLAQNVGQAGHSETPRLITETARCFSGNGLTKQNGQFSRISTESSGGGGVHSFDNYEQTVTNLKEETRIHTTGEINRVLSDEYAVDDHKQIKTDIKKKRSAMMSVNSKKHAVSKSISYTDTPTVGRGQYCEDKVIETKLVPSSVSEILPKAKNVSCDLCNYTTNRRSHLNEHYRIIHLKVRVVCDLCGKEFANINQHMRVVHKVLRSGILAKKECQECHKEFYDLTKHMAKAHNLKYVYDYDCNICNVKFKSKFILQRHMQRRHGDKSECGECGKKVSNLDVHIKKVHRNKKNGPQSCFMCQKEFRKLADLNRHLTYCKEKYESSFTVSQDETNSMSLVVENETGNEVVYENNSSDYINNPDKLLVNENESREENDNYLVNHSIIEDDSQFSTDIEIASIPLTCDVNNVYDKENKKGDQFKVNVEMNMTEQETHNTYISNKLSSLKPETEKELPLTEISIAPIVELTVQNNLLDTAAKSSDIKSQNFMECNGYDEEKSMGGSVDHELTKITKKNKPEDCPHCTLKCKNLAKHIEKAHKVKEIKSKNTTSYQCELCGYATNRTTNYNMHYKMVHLKSRTVCELCGKEYSNINQHMRVVHKTLKSGMTVKHKCGQCGQEYYDIQQHMRRAHRHLVQPRDCTCHICGEKFTKYANMKRHQQRVHQGIKITCDICQKQVSNIDKHKKVHINKDKSLGKDLVRVVNCSDILLYSNQTTNDESMNKPRVKTHLYSSPSEDLTSMGHFEIAEGDYIVTDSLDIDRRSESCSPMQSSEYLESNNFPLAKKVELANSLVQFTQLGQLLPPDSLTVNKEQ